MTGLKSHGQELAFKARSMGCKSHTLSPRGPEPHSRHLPRTFPHLPVGQLGYHPVVVPSRLTNSRRLLSVGTQGKIEAEWGSEAREPPGTVRLCAGCSPSGAPTPRTPPALAAHPRVLLPSAKSWLCMIFSTDVISINALCHPPRSGGSPSPSSSWGGARVRTVKHDHRTQSSSTALRTLRSAHGRRSRVCSLNRHINPTVRMLLQPDFREEAAEALGVKCQLPRGHRAWRLAPGYARPPAASAHWARARPGAASVEHQLV